MWWYALEDILLSSDQIRLSDGQVFDTSTPQGEVDTFLAIRRLIVNPLLDDPLACVAELFEAHAVDWLAYSRAARLGLGGGQGLVR